MSEETQRYGCISGFSDYDKTIKDLCDYDAHIVSTDLASLITEFHVPSEIMHHIETHIVDLVLDNARLINSGIHPRISLPNMQYQLDKLTKKR